MDFATIEKRRKTLKVPTTSLCVQAGISTRQYQRLSQGLHEPTPATMAKLLAALSRFKRAFAGEPGPLAVHAAYKGALILAAIKLNVGVRMVIASDPARKATADKQWLQAARVRQLAFWISIDLMGFRNSDVAAAAGVTKQAVSNAVTELRDAPDAQMQNIMFMLEDFFS